MCTGYSTTEIKAECTIPLTPAECADVAHNFVDSVGVIHGVAIHCDALKQCKLVGFYFLEGDPTYLGAACTKDGTFLGWVADERSQ